MNNTVTTYSLNMKKPGAGSGKLRAVFITDLHNAVWNGDENYLPGLIEDAKPDLILCGGDMIVARPGYSVEPGLAFMKKMLGIAPVYFAPGNHEFRSRIYPENYKTMYNDFLDPLVDSGMIFLENKSRNVSVNGTELKIFGLEIPRENYKRFHNTGLSKENVEKLIGKPDRNKINILLAHNPKYMDTYYRWGAELTLCGHYHGGVGRIGEHRGLISPGLMPFPGNAHGLYKKGRKTLIVSAGLGEHTIPVRINNPRELVILDIEVNDGFIR